MQQIAAETAAHAIRNLTTMLIAAMLLLYALTKDETLLDEIVEAIRANEEKPLAAA